MVEVKQKLIKILKRKKFVKASFPVDHDEVAALEEEKIHIHRRIYNDTEFHKVHPANLFMGFSFLSMLKSIWLKNVKPSKECGKRTLYNRIPAVKWLKNYKRELVLPDLLAGITVCF